MRGYIGSQDSFMKKVLEEAETNSAMLLPQEELEEKSREVFLKTLTEKEPLSDHCQIHFYSLLSTETGFMQFCSHADSSA
jgi:hypothetical protein